VKQLTTDYVFELFKLCLIDVKSLETCKLHLKYHYLYNDTQKKCFKFLFDTYELTHITPTIGVIGQAFSTDQEVINFLSKVKRLVIQKEQYDEVLNTFEAFIIDSKFRVLYEKIGDLYNEGKQKEAVDLLSKESQVISQFSLKDKYYTTVFKGYQDRQLKRQNEKDTVLLEKLTFGIHELDDLTKGGFNKGTSVLIMARSGVGKSTFLRWVGLCNARLGRRVVHFQAEGTEQEVLDAYDAGWTAINLHDIEFGNIPETKKINILKAQRDILGNGGEIYVYASESFDSMLMNDARDIIDDIEQIHGKVDLVIFDYLELFNVKGVFGSSEASERKRREELANKITNIGVEKRCGVIAATQSMDIPPDKINNPEFVMTRHHISEFKNVVKPFSYFLTLNQTADEYESEMMRIFCDKFRKYRSGQTVRIYQSRSNSRFYNSVKTLKEIYNKV